LMSSSGSLNEGSSVSDSSLPGHSSGDSFGSNASGSSGSNMQIWQWVLLLGLLLCCKAAICGAIMSMSGKKKPNKKKPIKKVGGPNVTPGVTTLKTAAKVGDSSLDIHDSFGFKVGDLIGIDDGTSAEERNEIKGFGSILCASPLKFAHAAGARVVKVDPLPEAAAAPALEAEAVMEPLLAPVAPVAYAMPSMQAAYAMPATTAYAMPATTSFARAAPMTTAAYAMPATTSYATAAPMTTAAYAMPAAAPYAMAAQSQYAI